MSYQKNWCVYMSFDIKRNLHTSIISWWLVVFFFVQEKCMHQIGLFWQMCALDFWATHKLWGKSWIVTTYIPDAGNSCNPQFDTDRNTNWIRSAHVQDLLKGSSASLEHTIMWTWNLTFMNTCTIQSSTSKGHWVGAECNDHAINIVHSWWRLAYVLEFHRLSAGNYWGGRPGELNEMTP